MKIDKGLLNTATSFIAGFIPTKSLSPIYKTIHIDSDGEKIAFRGKSTELEGRITIPAEGDIFTICADPILASLVNYFPSGDLDLIVGDKVTLKQGRKKHQFSFVDPEKYPKEGTVKDYQEFDPKVFSAIFTKMAPCLMDKPVDYPALKAFSVTSDRVVSADGTRLSLLTESLPSNIHSLPIGRVLMSVINKVNSLGENDKFEVSFGPNVGLRATLESGIVWEIIIKGLRDEYPDIEKVINAFLDKEPEVVISGQISVFMSILEVASLYSARAYEDNKATHLIIKVENGEVRCSMTVKDLVNMEEVLECTLEGGGDGFEVWVDPILLKEALSSLKASEYHINFLGSKSPLIIKEDNWTYIQSAMAKPSEV